MKFFSMDHLICVGISVGVMMFFSMHDTIRNIDIFLTYGVVLASFRHVIGK